MKKRLFVLLLMGLFPALSAYAGSPGEVDQLLAMSLEDVMDLKVNISTNTQKSLSKAPAVISLITAEDIKATGTTNLMEILQGVPGIYIKNNLFGFKPLITFRGASGANVLLMVNGAPAKDLVWSPSIFWKGMPANMIERVEIIRGPGSALFGSDAAAGVINVITKTAGKINQSEVGVRAGSFDTQAGWMQHGTNWNGFDINFTADVSHTDGHQPFIAKDRLNASGHADYGWDNQDLHLSIGKENWRLLADYTRHDNVAIGLTGAAVLDPLTRANDSQTGLALLYNNASFAQDWGINAELRYRDIDYSSGNGFWERPPGPGQSLNDLSSAEQRLNFEASGLYSGFRNHQLRLGGGYVWQDLYFVKQLIDGVPGNFAPETVRRNNYLFVQDVWSLAEDWELTAGARYDHYSDFGGTLNPRLALVWQSTERLTTKLMYGQAFRAPSYLELYSQTSANASNPDLKPEKSRTWELSFSYLATRDLRLSANIYNFDRRDVIAPDPVTNKFENFDRYVTRGIELEAQWQATKTLRLAGNLTYMKEVESPLRDLAIPLQQAYLRADWAFMPNWNWNLQANWFDKRPLPIGDRRTQEGSYALADTTIRYSHDKQWEFAASIRNLFDEDAVDYSSTRLPNNLPLPGRNYYAEIRYKF
jgi:iron complex outermembrane receptor protein